MEIIKKYLKLPILLLLLAGMLLAQGDARADVGLPPAQPGSSLSPGDYETSVQMVSEQVEITIRAEENPQLPRRAYVTADFQMFNTGEEDENIEVWFPFGYTQPDKKAWKVIQVQDFRAWVNGDEKEITIEESDQWNIIWAHWPVSFPSAEEVAIQVSYTMLDNMISGPYLFHSFYYILETGAGWEDSIEQATITIHAPYPLQELDEFLKAPSFYVKPDGYTVEGNQVRWVLQDLEPTEADNIEFHLLPQGAHRAITDALEVLKSEPDDWEANYQLAWQIKQWTDFVPYLEREGYIDSIPDLNSLEALTADSYRKVLDEFPADPGVINSVLRYFYWNSSKIDSRDFQEFFYQAIQQFPDHEQLQENYQEAVETGKIGQGPASSSTPSPSPSPTAVSNTPTSLPVPTLEIPPTSGFSGSFNLIAGLVFIGAAAVLLVVAVRRKTT